MPVDSVFLIRGYVQQARQKKGMYTRLPREKAGRLSMPRPQLSGKAAAMSRYRQGAPRYTTSYIVTVLK